MVDSKLLKQLEFSAAGIAISSAITTGVLSSSGTDAVIHARTRAQVVRLGFGA